MPAPTSSLLGVARSEFDLAARTLHDMAMDPEVEAYAVAYLSYLAGHRSMRPTSLPLHMEVAAGARQRVLDVLLDIQRDAPGRFTFGLERQAEAVSLTVRWPTGAETIRGMSMADVRELRDQLSTWLANQRRG